MRSTLKEYKRRFGLLLEKNDESLIPSDLRTSIFAQSVKNGGEAEYEKVRLRGATCLPGWFLSMLTALTLCQ